MARKLGQGHRDARRRGTGVGPGFGSVIARIELLLGVDRGSCVRPEHPRSARRWWRSTFVAMPSSHGRAAGRSTSYVARWRNATANVSTASSSAMSGPIRRRRYATVAPKCRSNSSRNLSGSSSHAAMT